MLLPPITNPAPQWELRLNLADLSETEELARRLAQLLGAGDLLVLSGGLGAGKTTFTQALAEGLGVEGMVSSPTFVLSRIHRNLINGPDLVHVDAYRADADGFEAMDLYATLADSVTVVEWGRGTAEVALVGAEGSWLDLELTRIDSSLTATTPVKTSESVDAPASTTPGVVPSDSGGLGGSAEIITDFSETEEDILGTTRTAVLRAYGPRWRGISL